jgi:polyhydroxybutyrate depolymerase
MTHLLLAAALAFTAQAPEKETASEWTIRRTLSVDGQTRSYHAHLPAGYDVKKPAPVVMVLHGAGTNGRIMEFFCGMSNQADRSGFIAVYPNGTGLNPLYTWNAGWFPPIVPRVKRPDDVKFLAKVLDDLATVAAVDPTRIYVVGMSNGGMMAFRASAELSDRFAAMCSIAGTLVTESWQPKHPMPVLHFHGTEDTLVPWKGTGSPSLLKFPPIPDVMAICAKANGCRATPIITQVPKTKDELVVERHDYGVGKGGASVVLYVIEGGGHVWPGRLAPSFLGKTTYNIDGNDTIWNFLAPYRRLK